MKKTLLAVSIAALAATSANAAVKIYESETGSLSSYGRIQLELENYDGENTIQNNDSRLGFTGNTKINDDLTAFANVEFRFNPGLRNSDDAIDIRNSWLGVKGGWGSVKAGNFDSVVATYITKQADIFENLGWRSLDEGANNARATALAYETNDLNGLKLAVGLKHYASDKSQYAPKDAEIKDYMDDNAGATREEAYAELRSGSLTSADGDEQFNIQIAAKYQLNNELSFGLGFDQNNEDGNPAETTDPIIAASVEYATDAFNVGLVLESSDDVKVANLTGGFSYAYGDIYGLISFMDDDVVDGVDFALGANYKLASNFRVYGELAIGNDDLSEIQDANDKGTTAVTLGARYSW